MKIELNLSENEVTRLKIKAAQGGMSVPELLTSFANDLICGSQTNGSDERMYANDWYDRCGFTFGENSFLSKMAEDHVIEQYLETWDCLKSAREAYAEEEDEEIRQEISEDIEVYEAELKSAYSECGGKGDWEKELADAERKWRDGEAAV